MEIKTILLILLPILSAIISSYITYHFAIKTKQKEAMLKFKEEKYANLLILLQGFVGKTASSDNKKLFLEEFYKSWIYCSDNVIKSINKMLNLIMQSKGQPPNHNKGKEIIGTIVLEMRKDLLGKTKLNSNNFAYIDVIE